MRYYNLKKLCIVENGSKTFVIKRKKLEKLLNKTKTCKSNTAVYLSFTAQKNICLIYLNI